MGQMSMGGGDDDNNGVKAHRGKRSDVSGNRPAGFPGMPGQEESGNELRYLIRYGILFAIMLVVLLVFSRLRRRRQEG